MTLLVSCFKTKPILPSDSALCISAEANCPEHLKISSFPTDFISILSDMQDKSLIIFWKSEEGKLIIDENFTSGYFNSSISGSISRSFCVLHCLIPPFSNFSAK